MSLETLNAFIAKVQSDSGLLEKMKHVSEADGAVAIARSAGFENTAGDLIRQQARIASELSDDELEKVSGGTALNIFIKTFYAGLGLYVAGTAVAIAIDIDNM